MLSLTRSVKNTFALMNKMLPDVLSLIPDCWEDRSRDEGLIKLTHICRSWRENLVSRPSLWARLDCTNVEKTKTYIERSKSSPLEIYLGRVNRVPYREQAFILAIAHVDRLRSLSVSEDLPIRVLAKHFSCPAPLLRKLNISLGLQRTPILPDTLFNGDLSSLRELRLNGVITPLPWRNLSNLTTFELRHVHQDKILLTQLLNFFKSTPHLRHIELHDSIPNVSNAPAKRVISLPSLQELSITAQPPHSTLLNHLSIPAGASLRLEFTFSGREPPISSYLPESLDNLNNISYITTVNLNFGLDRRSMRLNGPSGDLYIIGNWIRGDEQPNAGTTRFLKSLGHFDTSRSQWLTVTSCHYHPKTPVTAWTLYQILRSMEDLRTLTLTRCNNLSFILTLNPDKNPDKTVLCPELKEIVLHINDPDQFHIGELLSMAEGRASGNAKLSGITIVSTNALAPRKEVFQLRKHVSRVDYKFDDVPPAWDALPVMQI